MPRDSDPTRREQLAERICENTINLISELEQIIIDVESWNALHPEHPPFDCEWARVALDFQRRSQAAWDAGDTVEAGRLNAECLKNMQQDRDPYAD